MADRHRLRELAGAAARTWTKPLQSDKHDDLAAREERTAMLQVEADYITAADPMTVTELLDRLEFLEEICGRRA